MITIPEEVERIIKTQPFLEEGLKRGIINLSALAREIRPQIEAKLYKSATEPAIIMALKRLSAKLSSGQLLPLAPQITGDITVRSNLVEITFANSKTLFEKYRRFLEQTKHQSDSFLTVTRGVYETTILVNASSFHQLKDAFKSEETKSTITNLSAITLRLPDDAVITPGLHYSILKQLAWNNINIIEEVSTFTEFTILVKSQDVDRAFSILSQLNT